MTDFMREPRSIQAVRACRFLRWVKRLPVVKHLFIQGDQL